MRKNPQRVEVAGGIFAAEIANHGPMQAALPVFANSAFWKAVKSLIPTQSLLPRAIRAKSSRSSRRLIP